MEYQGGYLQFLQTTRTISAFYSLIYESYNGRVAAYGRVDVGRVANTYSLSQLNFHPPLLIYTYEKKSGCKLTYQSNIMGEPGTEFSVYLSYEDVTFGVSLKKNISYNQLAGIVKKKFRLNDSCNLMFTYKVGTKCVHIVDDDDVKFYANEICKGKGTPQTIFIKKFDQCFMANPSSSSKPIGIDLNVPLFPNDSQLPKKENFQHPQNYLNKQYTMQYDAQLPTKEYFENHNDFIENDHYEHDWEMNTLKYIHSAPDPQPIIKTPRIKNENTQCILKTGDKFDNV